MGKLYDALDERLVDFIQAQHMFFVATAPLAGEGYLNISPKGLDSFRVFAPRQVAYVDLVGSGIETVAHVKENGRLVIMFCAFASQPLILRLYGKARVVEPGAPAWSELLSRFPAYENARTIIILDIDRIADACGFGVPQMRFESNREQLIKWPEGKGERAIEHYKATRNATSIDGLPGLTPNPE